MITVKFFAMLKEKVGSEEAELPVEKELNLEELKDALRTRFPELAPYLEKRRVLISVNQEFANSETIVKDGDEVAILPAFSGG